MKLQPRLFNLSTKNLKSQKASLKLTNKHNILFVKSLLYETESFNFLPNLISLPINSDEFKPF